MMLREVSKKKGIILKKNITDYTKTRIFPYPRAMMREDNREKIYQNK